MHHFLAKNYAPPIILRGRTYFLNGHTAGEQAMPF